MKPLNYFYIIKLYFMSDDILFHVIFICFIANPKAQAKAKAWPGWLYIHTVNNK